MSAVAPAAAPARVQWTGDNLEAVRAFLRDQSGIEYPDDWVELVPTDIDDECALAIMRDDLVLVDVGQWIRWVDGRPEVEATR